MSGFDPGWLDLREAADHRALAGAPLARLEALFGSRDKVSIADLGAGSGSLLRALAPRLCRRQRWTLVEHDPRLVEHAKARLALWAERYETRSAGLLLAKDGREIEVAFARHDLAADPLPPAAAGADLVTAAAFFDLVGADWLDTFVARLAQARRPLYAPLIYAGRKAFSPRHADDAAILAAFNRHQRGDKGFGPALGPDAAEALAGAAETAGFERLSAPSPWRLGSEDTRLTRRLARDMAAAIAELPDGPAFAEWLAFRLASAETGAEVAHVDVLLELRKK